MGVQRWILGANVSSLTFDAPSPTTQEPETKSTLAQHSPFSFLFSKKFISYLCKI
ncbi:unnamed protein product [Prunus brigantina]